MTISAIIMMVIGLGITWGGAAVCIKRAMDKQQNVKFHTKKRRQLPAFFYTYISSILETVLDANGAAKLQVSTFVKIQLWMYLAIKVPAA